MASIYKRKSIWYLSYYHQKKRIRKKIGKNKKLAELARADVQLKIEKINAGFVDTRIPFADFLTAINDRVNKLSPKTSQRYSEVLNHFAQFIQSQPQIKYLKQINTDLLNIYMRDRAQKIHTNTVNYELRVLHSFFLYFIKVGKLQSSPVANVQRFAESPKTPRYLTKDEINRLFKVIPKDYLPYFVTLLYTGIRKDELLNLTWDDVHDNVLYIRPKKNWRPKSKTSIRQIPIHPLVAQAIAERRQINQKSDYIFSAPSGARLSKNVLYKHLKNYCKSAGLQYVTIHTFRHTFASHLVQKGFSIYIVSKLLGHHSVTQTEIYAHLAPSPSLQILIEGLPSIK